MTPTRIVLIALTLFGCAHDPRVDACKRQCEVEASRCPLSKYACRERHKSCYRACNMGADPADVSRGD